MFEGLSDRLNQTLKKVRGQSKITEDNISDAIKEIRQSLLEADVHFKVVKSLIDRVKAKALGAEVLKSIDAGQQFVKIFHEELKSTLGTEAVDLDVRSNPSVILLVGLQGVGKTTTASKLGLHVRNKLKKKPGLVPADIYRPAAIEQLQTLGKQNQIPVFPTQAGMSVKEIILKAKTWAKEEMIEVVILDTAGRLQIDSALMDELALVKSEWPPNEILLVADAMLGQQSVDVASGFHEKLGLTGLVLTKVDGDARGGAALSIKEVTGVPIKFLGVGEKASNLEIFHPDRLAGRILDMGDILSLVERAGELITEEEAKESARKLAKNQFTFEDFLKQIQMLRKMGGFESIMKMIPGMGGALKQMKNMSPPEDEIKRIEAIIRSMTRSERENHKILNGSRRLRIAAGSGTEVKDVNKLVTQFEKTQKMMSQMMKMGMGRKGKGGFPAF